MPQIIKGNRFLDFGIGFYTTSCKEQAERWAEKVCLRTENGKKIISAFDFDSEKAKKSLKILTFKKADEAWLEFVAANRCGKAVADYDIAIGPVADDNVYATIKLFETKVLDAEETIRRLKTETLFNQLLFHTEKALNYCKFQKSEALI